MRLMFQDKARFGRLSDTRYCWARRPMRPLVKAMLIHQYTYAYGAVSPLDGKFDSLVKDRRAKAWRVKSLHSGWARTSCSLGIWTVIRS
jgi:hypothetical protein